MILNKNQNNISVHTFTKTWKNRKEKKKKPPPVFCISMMQRVFTGEILKSVWQGSFWGSRCHFTLHRDPQHRSLARGCPLVVTSHRSLARGCPLVVTSRWGSPAAPEARPAVGAQQYRGLIDGWVPPGAHLRLSAWWLTRLPILFPFTLFVNTTGKQADLSDRATEFSQLGSWFDMNSFESELKRHFVLITHDLTGFQKGVQQ